MSEVVHTENASRHRERLLAGMAVSVRAKGFAATTLADVVREAGVSRRTFYEHFTDPTDCYLALAEELSDRLVAGVTGAMASEGTLAERIDRAVGVYLDMFAADPELNRSYWTEASVTGGRGRELHARLSGRMGRLMHDLSEDARRGDPELMEIPPEAGIMLASGLRELAILAYDAGRPLADVRATAVLVLRRFIGV